METLLKVILCSQHCCSVLSAHQRLLNAGACCCFSSSLLEGSIAVLHIILGLSQCYKGKKNVTSVQVGRYPEGFLVPFLGRALHPSVPGELVVAVAAVP